MRRTTGPVRWQRLSLDGDSKPFSRLYRWAKQSQVHSLRIKVFLKFLKTIKKKLNRSKSTICEIFFVYGDSQNLQKRPKRLWHICGTFCILEMVRRIWFKLLIFNL